MGGLGYEAMRRIKPDIIYAQQSGGMGSAGTYGKFRAVGGPIAAGLAGGTSEMSGLPSPAMPAGWGGYSYLDWIGAYSFGIAMLTAIHQRDMTGKGQWLDASQVETGIFISGTSILDFSANGRDWRRYGNRSPYKPPRRTGGRTAVWVRTGGWPLPASPIPSGRRWRGLPGDPTGWPTHGSPLCPSGSCIRTRWTGR